MRVFVAISVAALLLSCGEPPAAPTAPRDATTEAWYGQTVEQLTSTVRAADAFQKQGKADDAAALIEKAEPMASQVLAVHQPTLAAMEVAGDLDDLYGRMLLASRHYDWARFLFQKNLARWKHWTPATADTEARLKHAEAEIAACDKGMHISNE